MAVQNQEQPVRFRALPDLAAIELVTQRSRVRVLPGRLALVRPKPREVRHAIAVQVLAQEKSPPLEDREPPREGDRLAKKFHQIAIPRHFAPVEPTDLVVLTICV